MRKIYDTGYWGYLLACRGTLNDGEYVRCTSDDEPVNGVNVRYVFSEFAALGSSAGSRDKGCICTCFVCT